MSPKKRGSTWRPSSAGNIATNTCSKPYRLRRRRFFDYDQDDWLDIFLVNGWRLEGFAKGHEPVCHLFKNNRDGTFTDVTVKAGLARSELGGREACCVGSDYSVTMGGTTCS